MSDLLIPDLNPAVRRELERRALAHDRDVVEEARTLLQSGLGMNGPEQDIGPGPPPGMGFGTWLFSSVPQEFRGDDLVFEISDLPDEPPDFS